MKYFLLPDKQDYKIIKVNPDNEETFKKVYGNKVITEGNSVAEILLWFSNQQEELQEKLQE